jgi:hypothetical protein
MTDSNFLDSDSRRSFMKKGALASGALSLGLGSVGGAAAQQSDDQAEGGKALMFNDEFRPGAQFRVVSPVLEENPDVRGVSQGSLWSEYNTRAIEYLNTNEQVMFFPAHAAETQQGQVYELERNFSLFSDDTNDQGIISVAFEPVDEDGILFPDDGQLDPDEDFGLLDGGGKALLRGHDFHPGSLIRITSGVVSWTPREAVQGSDPFTGYNTRHAEYLNTGDDFLIYTAQGGQFQQGGVYVLEKEFDITDPEGNLVTADLDRVNEEDLSDDILDGGGGNSGGSGDSSGTNNSST